MTLTDNSDDSKILDNRNFLCVAPQVLITIEILQEIMSSIGLLKQVEYGDIWTTCKVVRFANDLSSSRRYASILHLDEVRSIPKRVKKSLEMWYAQIVKKREKHMYNMPIFNIAILG